MSNVTRTLLVVLLVLIADHSLGQSDESKFSVRPFVSGGANFGGTVSSNNFLYASGINLQIGVVHPFNDQVQLGIGAGIENFDEDYFYPVFFRTDAAIFKNENARLFFQTGYALAERRSQTPYLASELEGGYFIETGRLWVINVSEKIELHSCIAFKYQFAEVEYGGENSALESDIDYLSLSIRGGILLK